MPAPAYYCKLQTLKVFVILIASLLLFSCASHHSAPVTDRSQKALWRPKTHVVSPGDTLFSIAWRYGLKYEDLAKFNGIKAPYVIRPSQVIRLDLFGSGGLGNVNRPNQSSVTADYLGKKEPPKTSDPKDVRKENKTKAPRAIGKNAVNLGAPQWRWPSRGTILSSFQGNDGFNKGIDLGGKLGEPVLAAAAGQVVYAGSGLRGYGKLLIIKHNETFLSAYAHNERLRVKEGDLVKVGQVIADMGSSGTDRVMLHFEIRRDGTPVDPLKYLPRR